MVLVTGPSFLGNLHTHKWQAQSIENKGWETKEEKRSQRRLKRKLGERRGVERRGEERGEERREEERGHTHTGEKERGKEGNQ